MGNKKNIPRIPPNAKPAERDGMEPCMKNNRVFSVKCV